MRFHPALYCASTLFENMSLKVRRIIWAGSVARMEGKIVYGGRARGKDLQVGGRMILKLILKK
jgi:hypothetical protein